MKSSLLLPLCTAALVAAVYPPQVVLGDSQQAAIVEADKYLIELAPGETQWVTEDDKWALRRVSAFFLVAAVQVVSVANVCSERHQLHGHHRDV